MKIGQIIRCYVQFLFHPNISFMLERKDFLSFFNSTPVIPIQISVSYREYCRNIAKVMVEYFLQILHQY